MENLPGRPIYVLDSNLTEKPVTLLRCMIVAFVLIASTCIIHSRDDEPFMLKNKGPTTKQSDNSDSYARKNAFLSKRPERHHKQKDRKNAAKQSQKV